VIRFARNTTCVVMFMSACMACAGGAYAAPQASTVKSDETIVLFPTVAHLPAGGDEWEVALHGWIYEPSRFTTLKEWWAKIAPDEADVDEENDLDDDVDEDAQIATNGAVRGQTTSMPASQPRVRKRDILRARAHFFLVDNERGKRIAIRVAGARHVTEPSTPNGHFRGIARLDKRVLNDHCPVPRPGEVERDVAIPIQVDLPDGDDRFFATDVYFLRERGVSVISDIDDTIKITEVQSKRACTRNTFLRPFRAVPGMAALYQAWAGQGATVHYVSAGPWQLFVPLRDFMSEAGFPAGPMLMREFRWKDRSAWDLFDSPHDYKVRIIAGIIDRFPNRRFILVGDSGQDDPEAFGELARRYPEAVRRVLIRDVGGGSERMAKAFLGVPPHKWRVFKDPGEIDRSLESLLATPPALASQPAQSR